MTMYLDGKARKKCKKVPITKVSMLGYPFIERDCLCSGRSFNGLFQSIASQMPAVTTAFDLQS